MKMSLVVLAALAVSGCMVVPPTTRTVTKITATDGTITTVEETKAPAPVSATVWVWVPPPVVYYSVPYYGPSIWFGLHRRR